MTTGLYYDKDENSYMFMENYYLTFLSSKIFFAEIGNTYEFSPNSPREQDAIFIGPCNSASEALSLYPEYFI